MIIKKSAVGTPLNLGVILEHITKIMQDCMAVILIGIVLFLLALWFLPA